LSRPNANPLQRFRRAEDSLQHPRFQYSCEGGGTRQRPSSRRQAPPDVHRDPESHECDEDLDDGHSDRLWVVGVGDRQNNLVGALVATAMTTRPCRALCIDISNKMSIHSDMATASPRVLSRTRERRVPRTYRLPLSKIEAARRALGAATATETIERALELVVFQRALIRGTRAMLGIEIVSSDADR